jgi:hypothetical protein
VEQVLTEELLVPVAVEHQRQPQTGQAQAALPTQAAVVVVVVTLVAQAAQASSSSESVPHKQFDNEREIDEAVPFVPTAQTTRRIQQSQTKAGW